MANVALAGEVGLSSSPCLRRVGNLEQSGVIRGYVTLVDPEAVGLPVSIFVNVTLEKQIERELETFEKRVDAPEEHPGIPEMAPRCGVFLRGGTIGFFPEPKNRAQRWSPRVRFTRRACLTEFDVPIAGIRARRRYPDGNQCVLFLGKVQCGGDGGANTGAGGGSSIANTTTLQSGDGGYGVVVLRWVTEA